MSEATPIPWYVYENELAGYGDNGPNFYIVPEKTARDNNYIAVLSLTHKLLDNGETPEYLEAKATAALIVRAVNSHDDLVATLGEYLNWHEANFMLPSGNFEDPDQHSLARRARAAIKNSA